MKIHDAAAVVPVSSMPKGFAGAASAGTARKCARRQLKLVGRATKALPRNRRLQVCLTEQCPCGRCFYIGFILQTHSATTESF
jgi:hypothetical protein